VNGHKLTKPALGRVSHSGQTDADIVASVCSKADFEPASALWVDTRPRVSGSEGIKATTC
jgi:hypothetical protein